MSILKRFLYRNKKGRQITSFYAPEGSRTPDNAAPETAALSTELQMLTVYILYCIAKKCKGSWCFL